MAKDVIYSYVGNHDNLLHLYVLNVLRKFDAQTVLKLRNDPNYGAFRLKEPVVYHVETPRLFISRHTLHGRASCKFMGFC